MSDTIRGGIEKVQEEISRACHRSGRGEDQVRLMAITKNQWREAVEAAYGAGIRLFGENRVQEAIEKYGEPLEGAELHLVGHLQRNKAKHIVDLVTAVESIDKLSTARALARHLGDNGSLEILFEVNVSGEESKEGVANEEELWELIDGCLEIPQLKPRGLMTIAPFTSDATVLRRAFRRMAVLRDETGRRYPDHDMSELSMGMSNDYAIAIEEGATIVRIGTAIFGERV